MFQPLRRARSASRRAFAAPESFSSKSHDDLGYLGRRPIFSASEFAEGADKRVSQPAAARRAPKCAPQT